MEKADAQEATPILQAAMTALLAAAPTRGRPGSDLRSACGDIKANAMVLLVNDKAGPPLAECFGLAIKAGITQKQLSYVRSTTSKAAPVTVGGILIKHSIIHMGLAAEGRAIADMRFRTRQEVDQLKLSMNEVFKAAEEIAADEMDQMTYRALVNLHAAITFHLIETARPLPRMLKFRFAAPMPTLAMAHRLYYDASRADELRVENEVVHPAFMLRTGQALSA